MLNPMKYLLSANQMSLFQYLILNHSFIATTSSISYSNKGRHINGSQYNYMCIYFVQYNFINLHFKYIDMKRRKKKKTLKSNRI